MTYFQTRLKFHFHNYKSNYDERISKAGDELKASNKYKNEIQEEAKERWRHLGNLFSEFRCAWEDDKRYVLDVWIQDYIDKNQSSEQQVDELAHYFAYEKFVIETSGSTIYRTLKDSYEEAALSGWITYPPGQHQSETTSDESALLVWRKLPKIEVVDFLKFAYALHHSGILIASSGKVSDTVELLAERLEFKLPQQWYSNLTMAFEGVNSDFYHFEFLDEIKSGLSIYIDSRNAKKEKKKRNI